MRNFICTTFRSLRSLGHRVIIVLGGITMIGVTFVFRSRWRRTNRPSSPPSSSSGITENPIFKPPVQPDKSVFESAVVMDDPNTINTESQTTEKDEKINPQVIVRKVSADGNGNDWIVIGDDTDGSDSDDLD